MKSAKLALTTLLSTSALVALASLGCSSNETDQPTETGGTTSSGSGGSDSLTGGRAGTGGSVSTGGDGGGPETPSGTPTEINGQLRVCGTQLCNQHGNPIQLRGMSTHGLQWYGLGDCVTEASLDSLAKDWGADILRISLYVQEGGYETDPAGFTSDVDQIIEWVSARGMYALVDWHMLHPGDPNENLENARTYFTHIAQTHGDKSNILYEIANEPNDDPVDISWADIKSYANEMIPLIRGIDPEAVILVGTPDWSSFGLSGSEGPDEITADPLNEENVMYTFHFYAASHTEYYRDGIFPIADQLPLFVTEWGTQEFTGDGPNDFASSQLYIDWMREKKISWTSWNFSDDMRTGAAFKEGTCADGPFTGSNLKEAGAWVQDKILNPPDSFPVD